MSAPNRQWVITQRKSTAASSLPLQGGSITAQLPQCEVQQILQTGLRDQAMWYTKGNPHGLQIAVVSTAPSLVTHHSRQQHPTGGRYWRSAAPEPIPADLLHAPSSLGPAPDNNHWDQPHVHPQQQPQLRRSSLPWASSGSDQEGKAGEFLRALASSSVDGLCLSSMLGSLRVLLGSASPPHSHKAELGLLLPLPWAVPASEAHLHHPLKTSSPCFCCWQQL